jgi:hypothetical protein
MRVPESTKVDSFITIYLDLQLSRWVIVRPTSNLKKVLTIRVCAAARLEALGVWFLIVLSPLHFSGIIFIEEVILRYLMLPSLASMEALSG